MLKIYVFIFFLSVSCIVSDAQTTTAIQDFEALQAAPVWNYIATGGTASTVHTGTLANARIYSGASNNITSVSTFDAMEGLQITTVNFLYRIDFDNTITAINNGQFKGTGFSPAPIGGQLNSDSWAMTGWTDGALTFGSTKTTTGTDYTRGSSNGGVS